MTAIAILSSCESKREIEKNGTFTIDPDRNENISIFELFSKVELIPLETTDESLLTFPIGEPDKVIKHKDCFYFLDTQQDAIITFDSKGRFLRRFNRTG
jgi:hypothetical protein